MKKLALLFLVFGLGVLYGKNSQVKPVTRQAVEVKPTGDIAKLKSQVLPEEGITVDLPWGNLGARLVEIGVIDRVKFDKLFSGQKELYKYLEPGDESKITVNSANAQFWVDMLWAVGLANKSDVLDKGPMKESGNPAGFASTGGWTLGKKEAMTYYSKYSLIPLSSQEQERVRRIAENIYRPCCGNHTAFPDCNHGMAALAIVEMLVAQNRPDEEIYKTVLAFNSYWFGQTYLELGYHFAKNGTSWDKVDPKLVLSKSFSSAMGYQAVKKQIGNVAGLNDDQGGGGCGV